MTGVLVSADWKFCETSRNRRSRFAAVISMVVNVSALRAGGSSGSGWASGANAANESGGSCANVNPCSTVSVEPEELTSDALAGAGLAHRFVIGHVTNLEHLCDR